MDYEDYIIRLSELEKNGPQKPEAAAAPSAPASEPKKRIARIRSFLGKALKKPLVVDFSKDAKSSFTTFPGYQRSYLKRD